MRRWILAQNVKVMNLAQLFAVRDVLDWKTLSNAKFAVGDIVYIYATKPEGRIKYKMRVVTTDIPFEYSLDQKQFFTDKEQYLSGKLGGSYFRLQLLAEAPSHSSSELNTARLFSLGVKTLQGPSVVAGKLLEHIEQQFSQEVEDTAEERIPLPQDAEDTPKEEEMPYMVSRIVLSRSESHRQQRARINERLAANYGPSGGTDYMQYKISVLMPDRSIIANYATYESFIEVIKYIGFERVANLGLKFGKYPIVTKKPVGSKYKKAFGQWHVIANWPTVVAAQYVNKIADALDLYIECDVVSK